LVDELIAGTSPLLQPPQPFQPQQEEQEQREELQRWQKCVIADLRKGRNVLRKFQTSKIDGGIYKEIESYLRGVKEVWQVKKIFEPYLTKEAKILNKVVGLRNELDEIINAKTS
jgi:hypothetical protein